jgi:tRNA(Ile)-lysidine synthase
MSLAEDFQQNIEQQQLFPKNSLLLLAVSGGVDSVVLCELCYRSSYNFVIAHCNFQLRGEESSRDEYFVRTLGDRYQKPVLVKTFDTQHYAQQHKVSIQVAARELRYNWFYDLLLKEGHDENNIDIAGASALPASPGFLLTAHHADDNIETVLMNFFKGTGIAGLRGILARQGKLIRPLLPFRKEQLLAFAREQQLKWVEDSSNLTEKYSRNYFRHQLLPLVQKLYPQAESNMLDNIERFKDAALLYQQAIAIHKKKLLEHKGNEIHIPVLKLQQAEPLRTVVYEIVKEYGFTAQQLGDIISLLQADSGKYVQSATHRVIRNRNWLVIAPIANEDSQFILVEKGEQDIECNSFRLRFSAVDAIDMPANIPADRNIAFLDHRNIRYPLIVRKWKAGDYFYPLGMKKKKKLARFFIDQKLSKTEKENIWVLESDKKILWVIGHRIDERFKIIPSSKQVLRVSISNL